MMYVHYGSDKYEEERFEQYLQPFLSIGRCPREKHSRTWSWFINCKIDYRIARWQDSYPYPVPKRNGIFLLFATAYELVQFHIRLNTFHDALNQLVLIHKIL